VAAAWTPSGQSTAVPTTVPGSGDDVTAVGGFPDPAGGGPQGCVDLSLVEPWARRHHGLITRAAAAEAGVSRASWYRALAAVRLEMVQPGVARLWGSPRTREQRIAAAVLSVGRGALASHRSAAYLWGVERPRDDPVDLVIPRREQVPDLAGVVVHRVARHAGVPTSRRGIPVTDPLRMLGDLAAVDAGGVAAAVEHVVVAGWVRPSALRACVAHVSGVEPAGTTTLRRVALTWSPGDKPTAGVLEPVMTKFLADHGLPPAEFRPIIEGRRVDFWIVGTSVIVECAGWEFHVTSPAEFARDRERDAVLTAAGYVVVRVTWEHVTRRAGATARRIGAAISSRDHARRRSA
jgi:very-short-patch-repair endonuclease